MTFNLLKSVLAGAALALAASVAAAQTREDLTIQTADGPRRAIVLAAGAGPRPTVLVLHGALGTAEQTARTTGFAEAAAERGFTAVFPDGLRRRWHDGRRGGGGGPDDVAFQAASTSPASPTAA